MPNAIETWSGGMKDNVHLIELFNPAQRRHEKSRLWEIPRNWRKATGARTDANEYVNEYANESFNEGVGCRCGKWLDAVAARNDDEE